MPIQGKGSSAIQSAAGSGTRAEAAALCSCLCLTEPRTDVARRMIELEAVDAHCLREHLIGRSGPNSEMPISAHVALYLGYEIR